MCFVILRDLPFFGHSVRHIPVPYFFYYVFFYYVLRVKGPHNVGDFSGRSGRSPGSLLTYLGLYICSNAPKEDFPGIKKVFFDQQVYFFLS